MSPSHTIHSSAWSPWWLCLRGWRCSPRGPPCPWTPPWRSSCHPAASQPQTGGSPPSLNTGLLLLLTCLQSLSLQEQREAFQIRVYDRSAGALGAIKSLIAGATMGGLSRRRESKVSPTRLSFSLPLLPLPRLSPLTRFHPRLSCYILWFPSTIIAHPPSCICRLVVLWLALPIVENSLCQIYNIMGGIPKQCVGRKHP